MFKTLEKLIDKTGADSVRLDIRQREAGGFQVIVTPILPETADGDLERATLAMPVVIQLGGAEPETEFCRDLDDYLEEIGAVAVDFRDRVRKQVAVATQKRGDDKKEDSENRTESSVMASEAKNPDSLF